MMAVLLCLVPLVLLQDPNVDVAADPKLQKKITISAKAEPVNDALKSIGSAAGVPVTAVANLWDLKVTVFCKDEPAGPMMDRIADVLGCTWVKDGETYRLEMPREAQLQRSAYEQAETRLMRKKVEDALTAIAKPSVGRVGTGVAAPPKTPTSPFAQMLAAMPSPTWAAFWRGEPQTYAPVTPPPPNSGGSARSFNTPPVQPIVNETQRVVLKYEPSLISVNRTPDDDGALHQRALVAYPEPPAELGELPFAKAVTHWNEKSIIPSDDNRFKKPVNSEPPLEVRGYFTPKRTMADQLEGFFKSTGISVVADAFSVSRRGRNSATDAKSWIQSIEGAKTKVDKGILGVRHNGFWRLRQFEIPENGRASYEQLAQIEPLTLDQYTTFLAKLKPAQAAGLTLEDGTSLKFDTNPIVRMSPALQFYSALSPDQRRQAHSGLDAENLSIPQKRAFFNAIMEGVLKGYGQPSYLGRLASGDFTGMGVVVAEESFEGEKDKRGKVRVGSRKFHIYLGDRAQPVRFTAEVKGPAPKEE